MVYIPTFTVKNQPNVGKYTIHGSYGYIHPGSPTIIFLEVGLGTAIFSSRGVYHHPKGTTIILTVVDFQGTCMIKKTPFTQVNILFVPWILWNLYHSVWGARIPSVLNEQCKQMVLRHVDLRQTKYILMKNTHLSIQQMYIYIYNSIWV